MKILICLSVGLLSLFCLVLLIFHIKSRKPIISLLKHMAMGVAALIAVNCLARFTGVHIPVNWWSALSASVFGLPAVCGMLVLQMIFMI